MIGKGGKTAVAFAVVLLGCGGTATISDDPLAEDDPRPPKRSLPDAGKVSPPSTSAPPGPSNDAGTKNIECLGQKLEAWACEGFEVTAAPLAPFAVMLANGTVARATNRAIGGVASIRATFDPLPASGKAQVVFDKPNSTPSGMAVQFSVYVDDDAHDVGKDIALATLSGSTSRARLHFVPTATGNVLEVRTRTGGSEMKYPLGAAPKNDWVCIEIEVDEEGNLEVWRSKESKVAARLEGASPMQRAEVGIEWLYGANVNASKQFWFDDVIVGPRAVGCLH